MHVAMIDPSLFTLSYDLKVVGGLEAAGNKVSFFGKPIPPDEAIATSIKVQPHFYRVMTDWGLERLPKRLSKAVKGVCHLNDMQRLVQVLRKIRPDVIHFQWLPLPVIDQRFLGTLREIAPLVLTVHDTQPFNNSPGAAIQQLGATNIWRRFDRLIVHTEQSCRRLEEQGLDPHRIARVDHGFLNDDEPVAPPPAIVPNGKVRFVLFGKLKPYKGIDLLIDAVRRLSPEMLARCEVLVVGRPYMDMAPLVQSAASVGDAIRFDFRHVPDDELTAVLKAADVLVFPYREIEMSGVLMAAMRLTRPVIASNIGGFAELLTDHESALLVAPGEIDALAQAMTRMIGDDALRMRLAQGVADKVASIPDWAEIGRMTTQVYQGACADAAARMSYAAE